LFIETLDPDWIWIRIGIQPKMLDPDQMNADPKTDRRHLLDEQFRPVREHPMYLRAGECVYMAGVHVFTPGLNFIKAGGLAGRHPHFQVPHYENKKKFQ
jgi:hypothetical protein